MMMHQCNYCSESFFSGYSLMSHMRIHIKEEGKGHPGGTGNAFPGFVPPSTVVPGQPQVMDYSWHQNSWQWSHSSGNNNAGQALVTSGSTSTSSSKEGLPSQSSDPSNEDSNESSASGESLHAAGPTPNKKGKTYECPSCKKVFKSYPGLRYHRNSKHDQNGPYKCNFCDKRFCQKSHLSRHETLHTGEKNYACTYCDKTFRIKGNLQIHIRIHTGDKPYSCRSCGKKFTQQQSAKSHEKLHLKYK